MLTQWNMSCALCSPVHEPVCLASISRQHHTPVHTTSRQEAFSMKGHTKATRHTRDGPRNDQRCAPTWLSPPVHEPFCFASVGGQHLPPLPQPRQPTPLMPTAARQEAFNKIWSTQKPPPAHAMVHNMISAMHPTWPAFVPMLGGSAAALSTPTCP
jgi:hypothetical protein